MGTSVCTSLFALRILACMIVPAQICMRAHKRVFECMRVCVENMRLSCLTSKMLAHSVVWDYMLTGCLWWTTIYNNVKLTRSSWCAAGRLFNMTHPDACFVQQSFVLLRAVLRINNNATFYLLPVGCSVAAYSTPIVSVLLGNISGQMLACVWSCSQGASVYMPAPSLDSETW